MNASTQIAGIAADSLKRDQIDPRLHGDLTLVKFTERVRQMAAPRVLELGTMQSALGRSTLHRNFVPHAGEYLGTDIAPGVDVDIVADLHRLTDVTGSEQFDAIISCSTFEHLKYPHKAAHELMKALKIGGVLFIQTHQTFPLHAFPYDYFRFSREAIAGLFGSSMGFTVVGTDYEYPACIVASENPQAQQHAAYLNVRLFGEKHAQTPDDYIYEYDV